MNTQLGTQTFMKLSEIYDISVESTKVLCKEPFQD